MSDECERLQKANDVLISDLQSCQTQNETLRAEVERLRAREQAMREALKENGRCWEERDCMCDPRGVTTPCHKHHCLALIKATLAPDAGSTLLTREQVQLLLEALYAARQVIDTYEPAPMANVEARWRIENALAHARTLGFQ